MPRQHPTRQQQQKAVGGARAGAGTEEKQHAAEDAEVAQDED